MTKYLLDKFLYTVDRDPELVERYRADPAGTVTWWEAERANALLNSHTDEASTWLRFDEVERAALSTHDYVKLFELGAHPFLTLTLFIAMFERDHAEPLGFQKEYALRLAHFDLPYPDIAT
jgi:hypothetical protein